MTKYVTLKFTPSEMKALIVAMEDLESMSDETSWIDTVVKPLDKMLKRNGYKRTKDYVSSNIVVEKQFKTVHEE